MTPRTILAGDVGGTKTWLGLFEAGAPRPEPVETARYATLEFDGVRRLPGLLLEAMGHDAAVAGGVHSGGAARHA